MYKYKKYFFSVLILLFAFLVACNKLVQECEEYYNPYGLEIIYCVEKYNKLVEENPDMELVDIEKIIPNIVLDIRYATKNNFTKEIIYTEAKAFARKPVVEALKKVQDSLAHHNLKIKIYDAYRPYAATVKFYEVYPDTNFVANPKFGYRHNRGCALDITLLDLSTGKEIPMPTEFDDFSEKAHPQYPNFSKEIIDNRTFLFDIMSYFGFSHYPTEWWHFDYQGWENYPLMDLSFKDLTNINK